MRWFGVLATAMGLGLLASAALAQPERPTEGPPVVKMGVNDSRAGAIARLGDVNVYEFTIPGPGLFRFRVLNIPDAIAGGREIAKLHMIMTGPNGFQWSRFTREKEKTFRSEPFVLPPGTYQVKIKDYFDDDASPESYTIQTLFEPVDDPGEPNDTRESAAPLRSGRPARGYILPEKDVDYFQVTLVAPGALTITIKDIPPEIRERPGVPGLYLGLLDSQGRLLREYTSRPRQETLEVNEPVLNKGTYYLCVRDFREAAASASPYTIEAGFPGVKGELSAEERELLAAIAEAFRRSGDGIDSAERQLLDRLEARFLED